MNSMFNIAAKKFDGSLPCHSEFQGQRNVAFEKASELILLLR